MRDKYPELLKDKIAKLSSEIEGVKSFKEEVAKISTVDELKVFIEAKKEKNFGGIISSIETAIKNKEKNYQGNFIIKSIDNYMQALSKRSKWTKAITGLVSSLAMLPFTCALLNWVYPRFMEIAFPDLAKGGKKSSGTQYVGPPNFMHKLNLKEGGVKNVA